MSKIHRVELCHKHNYGVYDDCDSGTDYFHYTGEIPLRSLIQRIKEDGSDQIRVEVVNEDTRIPYQARIARIGRECGYTVEDKSEWRQSMIQEPDGAKPKWFHIEYLLTKKPLTVKVSDYPLYAGNGKKIRQATKVQFPDGETVKFLDKLPKSQAIEQAEKLRYIQ